MKILHVVGTRPNFMKVAPLIAAFSRQTPDADQILVHTGQHYDDDMSAVFFSDLGIPVPALNLGVGSGTHAEQTSRTMLALEPVIREADPRWVIAIGDVNSTLAAALVAAKLGIAVAHVEAGLRSWNRRHPEEVNRVVVDHVATLNFCPSERAARNLHNEGIVDGVHVVGDVMFDLIQLSLPRLRKVRSAADEIGLLDGSYVAATIHRPSNTDEP